MAGVRTHPIESLPFHLLYAGEASGSELEFFSRFHRIYTFHGDETVVANLARVSTVRHRDPRPPKGSYIVDHLAAILEPDAIALVSRAPRLRAPASPHHANAFYVHPGGGTGRRRWPVGNYAALVDRMRHSHAWLRLCLVLGEAELDIASVLAPLFDEVLDREPLDRLAARFSGCPYLGMDSGITHLAAASGARVLALFGPSDPSTWAQRRGNYAVLTGLDSLDSDRVWATMCTLIGGGSSP